MLDALETYLGEGGRFMYIGGNSLFGVTSIPADRPHVVEVRRWGAPWPFEMPPGERHHSSTGEQGGLWKNRGRAPNKLVGIGHGRRGLRPRLAVSADRGLLRPVRLVDLRRHRR